ncbi:MAG: hypothetical protein K0Q59_5994 [Paenibacillus sp.]|nr:hypothetical protein [Paenibacillus sp.]
MTRSLWRMAAGSFAPRGTVPTAARMQAFAPRAVPANGVLLFFWPYAPQKKIVRFRTIPFFNYKDLFVSPIKR